MIPTEKQIDDALDVLRNYSEVDEDVISFIGISAKKRMSIVHQFEEHKKGRQSKLKFLLEECGNRWIKIDDHFVKYNIVGNSRIYGLGEAYEIETSDEHEHKIHRERRIEK